MSPKRDENGVICDGCYQNSICYVFGGNPYSQTQCVGPYAAEYNYSGATRVGVSKR